MRPPLRTLTAAAAVASVALAGGALAAPRTDKASSAKTVTKTVECFQADGTTAAGTVTYVGPDQLWPPNHKYVPATVTFTEEDADDMFGYSFTAGHDQVVGGEELPGSGNTSDDIVPAAGMSTATGSETVDFLIRAERSGTVKAGRTYTIAGTVMYTDSDGDMSSMDSMTGCSWSFDVVVPHDQGASKA